MERTITLHKTLDDLETDQVLDVTTITSKLCCFAVKHVREIFKAKYLLRDHRVIADNYIAIAMAASILPSNSNGDDSDICSVNVIGSSMHLRIASPLSKHTRNRCGIGGTGGRTRRQGGRTRRQALAQRKQFLYMCRSIGPPNWLRGVHPIITPSHSKPLQANSKDNSEDYT